MRDPRQPVFSCRDVRVFVEDKPIVHGVSLDILPGERHALMGPNGSGKSTFAQALMGHPAYRVEGEILLRGERITELSPDQRARRGMFLGFQYPVAIPGLSVASFLRAAVAARRGDKPPIRQFRKELFEAFRVLSIPREFASRYLNDGFSGGEKKRLELLQLLLLEPAFALLDEIDSGLDIDALKVVASGIDRGLGEKQGLLMVTHYQRILDHVPPDRVHVFVAGRIARSGGPEQALELEARGYEQIDGGVGEPTASPAPSELPRS
jgi:Fe-S cluster assembly ATP-binding protein